MLQKLEDAYLAILRTVVILASGVLLIGVVMFGLGALKGFGDGPGDEITPPRIAPSAVIETMTAPPDAGSADDASPANEPRARGDDTDRNQAHYDKAAKAIVAFVERVSDGNEGTSVEQVVRITRDRAEAFDDAALTDAYAAGFADAAEQALADERIAALARGSSGIEVANQLLNTYGEAFSAEVEAAQARVAEAQQAHALAKVESASNLYLAAACFGMFLLIVFLSIFIKIERNLRHLERKP